jgi:AraC-like DNA-binding protein
MGHQLQITTFRAEQLQRLRNVTIHSPSLVQILSGNKQLFWKESTITLSHSTLLLCHARLSLNFANLPVKGAFVSRMFSFYGQPSEGVLALNDDHRSTVESPILTCDKGLEDTLNALASLNLSAMSEQVQNDWQRPLFQQLAEKGILHLLFPQKDVPLSLRLSQYLSQSPSDDHRLDDVAARFAMSRATLIRKLKIEGTRYRELLAEVRFSHALYLMQAQRWSVIQLAHMCGYQSAERFSLRFRSKYGLSPRDYMRTVHSASPS